MKAMHAQLLAQIPLPSVDEVYQTVIHTERLHNKGGKEMQNVMAFKVETKHRAKYGDKSDKFCPHCNREGYDEASCNQNTGGMRKSGEVEALGEVVGARGAWRQRRTCERGW